MPDNSRVDQQGFNSNSRLRASDRDRDRAASVINEALAEGRLTAEEHSERLDAIYAAKTHAEIVPLLEDLPEQANAAASAIPEGKPVPAGRMSRIISVLSGATRKGVWHPEPVTEVVAVLGGADLDFREAVLPAREITLRVVTVLGGVNVVVPPEMRVIDSGVAVLGGREITGNSDDSVQPNAPVLRITGVSVLGGMDVKRKPRKQKR